jgi:hypothetical protein
MQAQTREYTSAAEAEFSDVIGTKVLRVFLLFTVTSTNGFYPPPPPPSKSGFLSVFNVSILYGNIKSQNSQDYAQKTQRNCTFMNSPSILSHIDPLPSLCC